MGYGSHSTAGGVVAKMKLPFPKVPKEGGLSGRLFLSFFIDYNTLEQVRCVLRCAESVQKYYA